MPTKEQLLKEIKKQYGSDLNRLKLDLQKYAGNKKSSRARAPKGPVIASLQGVKKIYKTGGNKVEAVKGVSFDIHQGEIVALVGPSGSGKSSILNLIGGLDKPSDGNLIVDSENLKDLNDKELSNFRNRTIGFVFQFFYLQPFLDLKTNVEIPTMFGKTIKSVRQENASKLIDSVGLSDRSTHKPKELSGGQIQRTAIARALVNNPKLVLADEPTGNLDSKNGEQIMDLFESIRQKYNTAILLVTHDEKTAARADRVITLEDGVLV